MGILVICTRRKRSDTSWIGRCRWTGTLAHELPQTVVVLYEVIEPLLDLLGIPEESFALCEGFVLLLRAVENSFEPSEPELEGDGDVALELSF